MKKSNINNWNGWGVSTKGPLHKTTKMPNQDSYIFKKLSWGTIAVVSDGLGSHKHSHIGSKSACVSVVEAAKICLKKNDIKDINPLLFFNLIQKIWLNEIYPYAPSQSSATCLLAIQKNDNILLAQLGDGMIITLSEKNSNILKNDNDFSNITTSFTENFYKDNWKYQILNTKKINSIVMITDGISDDLIIEKVIDFSSTVCNTYNNYNPKDRYYKVLYWLKNWPTPKHTDDKTILCLNKQCNDSDFSY